MRFLFISYAFPGPLGAMASWLAANADNQVIFASSRSRQEIPLSNVQRVVMKNYPGKVRDDPDYFDLLDEAVRAGKSAAATLNMVKSSGYEPDMIFCATSNGAAMGIKNIFPDAFIINFLEDEIFSKPGQAAIRRNLQCLQILHANMAFAFYEETRKVFPDELRSKIDLAPHVIDTSFFDPACAVPYVCEKFQSLSDHLVVVFTHGLSEHELFYCWHFCLDVLKLDEECQIIMLANGSYLMKRLRQLPVPNSLNERLYIEAHIRQDMFRDLLAASSASVFFGKSMPMGLLESMSCASTPVCMATRPFFIHKRNMLALNNREEAALQLAAQLRSLDELRDMGLEARETAIGQFGCASIMPQFFGRIHSAWQQWNS